MSHALTDDGDGDIHVSGYASPGVPGLVVLHSKDLVNWEFSSYCFDRFDDSDDAKRHRITV